MSPAFNLLLVAGVLAFGISALLLHLRPTISLLGHAFTTGICVGATVLAGLALILGAYFGEVLWPDALTRSGAASGLGAILGCLYHVLFAKRHRTTARS